MNQQLQSLIHDIYDAIQDGSIVKEQQLLTERELCEVFHVKRGVLQKALVALETLGIIDIQERQGIFVVDASNNLLSDDLPFLLRHSPMFIHDQALETRLILEPEAARIAAKNCTEKWAAALEHETQFMEELLANDTMDTDSKAEICYQHNIILHNMIIEMTGNVIMTNIHAYVSNLSRNVLSILGRTPNGFRPYALWPDVLMPEHKAITQAIVEQDPDRAEQAMRTHLINSQRRNSATVREKTDPHQEDAIR